MNVVEHALTKPKGTGKLKPKALKEFNAKELHDGKYIVKRHSGKPEDKPVEHTAENLNEVQAALEDHMGTPNEGESAAEPRQAPMGAGQPGMGGMAGEGV